MNDNIVAVCSCNWKSYPTISVTREKIRIRVMKHGVKTICLGVCGTINLQANTIFMSTLTHILYLIEEPDHFLIKRSVSLLSDCGKLGLIHQIKNGRKYL